MEGPVTFEGNNNVETSDSGEYAVGGKSKGKVLKGGSVKFNETNTVTWVKTFHYNCCKIAISLANDFRNAAEEVNTDKSAEPNSSGSQVALYQMENEP